MIQRVSDPFDDLVMDSNKSLKSIYKGSRRNGVRMAKRKKGMTFIPYDYEAAYNKSLEDMNEFFVEQMFKHGKKVVYALKEIRAGDQFEVEIYPQFKKMDEVPPEGRSIKKDNDKAQRNLNDKNARKYVERLINENFTDRDLWLTFTYDNEHLPPDGDIDAAIKNVQKFIRRVNYQRKKRGLPNARYVYVTAYNPTEEIRWHHHIVMDGDMDMDVVEGCWKQSSRNEVRRLQKDENGLTGMAKYIVEEKNRVKSEKRWNSSQGLRDPDIKVVHSKRPTAKAGGYKKIGTYVETMEKPFHLQELEARIRSLTRRKFVQKDVCLESGDIKFDTIKREAYAKEIKISLTRKEKGILEYLLLNLGRPVSQEELMEHVWDASVDSFSGAIRVHMSSLRRKLKAVLGHDVIMNKVGEGYKIREESDR